MSAGACSDSSRRTTDQSRYEAERSTFSFLGTSEKSLTARSKPRSTPRRSPPTPAPSHANVTRTLAAASEPFPSDGSCARIRSYNVRMLGDGSTPKSSVSCVRRAWNDRSASA
jgi:hypothetical protein